MSKVAKRLECAGFSGAVEPAKNLEKRMIPVVRTKSGAEVTAIQTLREFQVHAPETTTGCSRDSRDSDPVAQHAQWKFHFWVCLARELSLLLARPTGWNEEKIEMDFRRARHGVRAVAIHKPGAHEPAGRAGS